MIEELEEPRFGMHNLTIVELFEHYYGEGLPMDPSPMDIRARFAHLGRVYCELQLERTLCQQGKKRGEVTIFNNLVSMVDKQIKITQDMNMSLCNEKNILRTMT